MLRSQQGKDVGWLRAHQSLKAPFTPSRQGEDGGGAMACTLPECS